MDLMGMRMRPPTAMGMGMGMSMEDWRPQRRPPPTTVAMPSKAGKGMKGYPGYGMYPMGPMDPYGYQGPPMGLGRGMPYGLEYPPYDEDPYYYSYAPGGTLSKLYKGRMCRMWKETGMCPFDETCIFAHGAAELRDLTYPETDALHNFESSGARIYLKPDDPLLHRRDA
eukprot:TRINITY_DN2634_c0_g1_i1.p1 TRINITY_DN2634_c0_g1~~TRINITY_DN2634_c0_g1_i1.p1  ORF type:complete len:180 (+),score=41.64 TRINITY_DN2634_c0_g1_i1:35-541(+)